MILPVIAEPDYEASARSCAAICQPLTANGSTATRHADFPNGQFFAKIVICDGGFRLRRFPQLCSSMHCIRLVEAGLMCTINTRVKPLLQIIARYNSAFAARFTAYCFSFFISKDSLVRCATANQ